MSNVDGDDTSAKLKRSVELKLVRDVHLKLLCI